MVLARGIADQDQEYSVVGYLLYSFQIVILARVIVDRDQVSLSAEGVTTLVGLLNSTQEETMILSGKGTSLMKFTFNLQLMGTDLKFDLQPEFLTSTRYLKS